MQTKEKIPAFLLSILLSVFLAIYLAYLTDQVIRLFLRITHTDILNLHISVNPLDIPQYAKQFYAGMLLFGILYETIILIWLTYQFFFYKAKLSNVSEYKVTDYISIPRPVGNGQHGKAWFADEQEIRAISSDLNVKTQNEKIQSGIVLDYKNTIVRYMKNFAHSITIALTGAGKTRRVLLPSICLQILAGDSYFVTDVKGEIFYLTSKYAESQDYKIVVIDFINPEKSMQYNFLQPIIDALKEGKKKWEKQVKELVQEIEEIKKQENPSPEEVSALVAKRKDLENDYSWTDQAQEYTWDLVSTMVGEAKGEPLWYNGETSTLASSILAVCMEAPEQCQNLYNVYCFLAYMSKYYQELGKNLLSTYLERLPDTHPAKLIYMQAEVAEVRTRSSFNTSGLGTLRLFSSNKIGKMSMKTEFNLEDIGKQKTAIYFIVPDEKTTYHPLASLFMVQLYIKLVEEARKCGGSMKQKVVFDCDEIGNCPRIPILPAMLSVGRGRGISINLVVQDYQQLQAKYKDDFETIKSQCKLKIFLQSDGKETLKDISERLGDYTTENPNESSSRSTEVGSRATISGGSGLTGRRLLLPSELALFEKPDALVMVTGHRPFVSYLPDISETEFNNLLGLGDEKFTKKFILDYENSRKERDDKPLKQWGIWIKEKELMENKIKSLMEKNNV